MFFTTRRTTSSDQLLHHRINNNPSDGARDPEPKSSNAVSFADGCSLGQHRAYPVKEKTSSIVPWRTKLGTPTPESCGPRPVLPTLIHDANDQRESSPSNQLQQILLSAKLFSASGSSAL